MHGLADEQDAERGRHHDRGEDPEGHFAPRSVGGGRGVGAAVVVALVVAEPHRVRRLLHAGQQRGEEVGLLVDQVGTVGVGQLVLVRHRQRARRAGLDAQPAEDAAQVVDLVDAAVALAGAEPLVAVGAVAVGAALDVDRVGRAGPGAQLAADALLQPVGPAVELVTAVEAGCGRQLLEGVLLRHDLLEHRAERDPEPGDRVPELLLEALGLSHHFSWSAVGGAGHGRTVDRRTSAARRRRGPLHRRASAGSGSRRRRRRVSASPLGTVVARRRRCRR